MATVRERFEALPARLEGGSWEHGEDGSTRILDRLEVCDSPPEQLLLQGLAMLCRERDFDPVPPSAAGIELGTVFGMRRLSQAKFVCANQYPVTVTLPERWTNFREEQKRFRADFVVFAVFPPRAGRPYVRAVVVEVDGHDWHERTREQASSDRARDRLMLLRGWSVVRFTGRDVNEDPIGCAGEVFDTLEILTDEGY